jgi:hypothetical protein
VLTRVVLFCRIFSVCDTFLESEHKCKSDNEAKISCKVVALDDTAKKNSKLRGDVSGGVVG